MHHTFSSEANLVDIPLIFLLFASGWAQDIRSLYGYVLKNHWIHEKKIGEKRWGKTRHGEKKEKGKEIETRKRETGKTTYMEKRMEIGCKERKKGKTT